MSDFQADAGEQGRLFDQQARMVCRHAGFATVGPQPFEVAELGIEIDASLTTTKGTEIWAEFKGSWRGNRPGLRRTDTAKKALCDALLAWGDEDERPAFVILTSHTPEPGSRGDRMVAVAIAVGAVLGVLNINDPADVARLGEIARTL
jgi:hypothetical protein